ncbi:hypothetical protein GCM10007422_18670 [Pedobacter zeae]|uniref:Signal transduction histidine kinase internal region domain-containing protein n=1 Tax=Pedobacter zeae TaxID=1737356 RepID=A0ABQ1XUJ0_9SPHI|nr:hypothetical protein GCM10007422_18670 [Pedobacter zeae]
MYETVVVGLIFGIYGNPITYLAHYTINICFFYLNANIVLPWALANKKTALYKLPASLLSSIIVFILINFITDYLLIYLEIIKDRVPFTLNRDYSLRILYRCIYFLGFSTGYYFFRNYTQGKREIETLERNRLEEIIRNERITNALSSAQNSFLRAQINPHFLFNTLNFIYHNASSNLNDARAAIIALSDIMRYSLQGTDEGGDIALHDEIEQMRKLLYLYQLRRGKILNLDLTIDPHVGNLRLIPMVLLTLTENVFKHGNLERLDQKPIIAVYRDMDKLKIYTENLAKRQEEASGGNGLANIMARLKNAYGNAVTIEKHKDVNDVFSVNIEIQISALEHDVTSV